MLIGSHVGMGGKEMFLGSVKEAESYGANTFMVYTGAPQNTRRKELSELRIPEAQEEMRRNGIRDFVVHAPYIINLGNSVKEETFRLGVEFLVTELRRTEAMGSRTLVLHPGSHVGEGTDAGIAQVVKGLNLVFEEYDGPVKVALETMAGKGGELGRSFEELSRIYDGVRNNSMLRICFDTCHVNDAGYDLSEGPEKVLSEFNEYFPTNMIAVIHLNDSMNPCGAAKDRHANLGFGTIGFSALSAFAGLPCFADTPVILETPYVNREGKKERVYPPYAYEIAMLKNGVFEPGLLDRIREEAGKEMP